jgi:hypothetical protein
MRQGRLQRALGLGRREWRDLLAAQIELARAQAEVWRGRSGRLAALLDGVTNAPLPGTLAADEPTSDQWRRVAELERALERAVRYGALRPRPKCLARSIALARLMRAAGIPAVHVRIGVQRGDSGVTAHAWLELGRPPRVVGDRATHIAAFTPLADLAFLRPADARW